MRVVAIVQARMSSTRLPGKVLIPIGDRPMLWHVVTRAAQARRLSATAIATSADPANDAVAAFCHEHDIPCFRGSEDDVLDRYYQAAKAFDADVVVRLTADCPLIDPDVIDTVVSAYRPHDTDYVSNTIERSYPDGLDTEVFGFATLERAWLEAKWTSEREHVTPYIWKHPDLFRIAHVTQPEDLSALRWTVDEPRDLEFVRAIFGRLDPERFRMADVMALLRDEAELAGINAGIESNEGYQISLAHDGLVRQSEEP